MTDPLVNVAFRLLQTAKAQPHKVAVSSPAGGGYAHMTFRELNEQSDALAYGLERIGIRRGTRTILMVRPGPEFFIIIFSLFKTGAVPVVVDPGMGIRRMLKCLRESDPQAFIGIPAAHMLRLLRPACFNTIQRWVTVGRRWFWAGADMRRLLQSTPGPYPPVRTAADETAAILFTTGSTGAAKGVVYTHGNFAAQLQQIQTHLNLSEAEVDLSTFPLFALFWPALGITAVIPDMDPTRPARVNPEKIIRAITDRQATQMFASPALLNRVGSYGRKNGVILPSLKRVISAGAPVSAENIEQFSTLLTDGAEIHTPYGATEAVPILSIRSSEILAETRQLSSRGCGTCIGYPINDIRIEIIRITDDPVACWSDDLRVSDNEVGEIVVKGDLVTRRYYNRPQETLLAKIKDGNAFWHRMGDLARRDERGRFWFYGRKSQRVLTEAGPMFTIPCEALFNAHAAVYRSALVGIGPRGRQRPVVCIELHANARKASRRIKIEAELRRTAKSHALTRSIDTFLFHRSFPVDIRHNSKIFREKLAVWAEGKLS